jgi:SAM-dependent MidA family methyltransferase
MNDQRDAPTGAGCPTDAHSDPSLNSFGFVTHNPVLRRLILDEIDRQGRITFRQFMEMVLYHPDEGYYRVRKAIGRRGDYLTSPELHPLFGAVLARQLSQFWELLDRPVPFRVVEIGAGNGTLGRSLLTAGSPELQQAMQYSIVEPGMALRQRQAETLGALAKHVEWLDAFDGPMTGCVVSNELVDSFPVHRVTVAGGRLQEVYVCREGDRFVEKTDQPSTSGISAYFAALGLLPGEGCAAEVNLDALDWIAAIGDSITRGFVLTIDYGYAARRLYAHWRRAGTLLTFYQHTSGVDPYARIGLQDMTSHVDFTSLALAGERHGLVPLGFGSQQQVLAALGIRDALAGGPGAAAGLEEYLARRSAVNALLDPEGLGRIRVLAQGKGVGTPKLRGFAAPAGEELF